MDRLTHKIANRNRRQHRVRAKTTGSTERPRLAVRVSNLHVTAQIIDDAKGATIAYATTVGSGQQGNLTDKARFVGTKIAKAAHRAKVKKVVFDRRGRKYHGRVKALAEAARGGGLEF